MSLSLLEVLANADYNLQTPTLGVISVKLGTMQLHNAFVLLEKGYDINDDFDTVMNGIENVEDVPYKT
jgi:hypothetical protein